MNDRHRLPMHWSRYGLAAARSRRLTWVHWVPRGVASSEQVCGRPTVVPCQGENPLQLRAEHIRRSCGATSPHKARWNKPMAQMLPYRIYAKMWGTKRRAMGEGTQQNLSVSEGVCQSGAVVRELTEISPFLIKSVQWMFLQALEAWRAQCLSVTA